MRAVGSLCDDGQSADGADMRGLPETNAVTWGANELGRADLTDGVDRLASHFGNLAGGPSVWTHFTTISPSD